MMDIPSGQVLPHAASSADAVSEAASLVKPSTGQGYCEHVFRCGDRTVAYATAGDPIGEPVLYFYPQGTSRRQLYMMHQQMEAASLRVVCVNRPGKQGTSPTQCEGKNAHLQAVCEDARSVLKELGVGKVSVLFMCAGTPFAIAFSSCFPELVTGQAVGVAPWVSPALCPDTTRLFRAASALPSWFTSSIGASCQSLGATSLSTLPTSFAVSGLESGLSAVERELFAASFPDRAEFVRQVVWMQEEGGGEGCDIEVLLSDYATLEGIDMDGANGSIYLCHGAEDTLVPPAAAIWFGRQLGEAAKCFNLVQGGTHQGMLFLLHPEIAEMLKLLKRAHG